MELFFFCPEIVSFLALFCIPLQSILSKKYETGNHDMNKREIFFHVGNKKEKKKAQHERIVKITEYLSGR